MGVPQSELAPRKVQPPRLPISSGAARMEDDTPDCDLICLDTFYCEESEEIIFVVVPTELMS
jgi:hypothetical protein